MSMRIRSEDDGAKVAMTDLGVVLRSIRIARNQLIGDMADKIGIRVSQLSGVELGKEEPAMDFFAALDAAYPDLSSVEKASVAMSGAFYRAFAGGEESPLEA